MEVELERGRPEEGRVELARAEEGRAEEGRLGGDGMGSSGVAPPLCRLCVAPSCRCRATCLATAPV
jgi:hypothetical protein